MSANLLQQFLTEECTQFVRTLLHEAIAARSSGSAPPKKRFEFNRFEVTLDFENGMAILEDVLDPSDAGAQRVPVDDFCASLAQERRHP